MILLEKVFSGQGGKMDRYSVDVQSIEVAMIKDTELGTPGQIGKMDRYSAIFSRFCSRSVSL